jgi:DNA-binding MarR family transcriptional regulator
METAVAKPAAPDLLMPVLRDFILGQVRLDGRDLSARQLGIFLVAYLESGPHTVRGLAVRLDISKPAVTRSVDRLEELGFARREPDPRDRRSVLVGRTDAGNRLLAGMRKALPKNVELNAS